MAVSGSKVIRLTADNDTHTFAGGKTKLKGVRLVAGSGADATAQVRETDSNGAIVYSLAAVQKTADESNICTNIDSNVIHADISGTGAEVFVYVE